MKVVKVDRSKSDLLITTKITALSSYTHMLETLQPSKIIPPRDLNRSFIISSNLAGLHIFLRIGKEKENKAKTRKGRPKTQRPHHKHKSQPNESRKKASVWTEHPPSIYEGLHKATRHVLWTTFSLF